MGCGQSSDKKTSNSIEESLSKDANRVRSEVKLLLLGAGESGKSTIVRQIRIIHLSGYSEAERSRFVVHIRRNVAQCMRQLVQGTYKLKLDLASDQHNAWADEFFPEDSMDDSWTSDKAKVLASLWGDPAIQEALARRNEIQVNDSAHYYLSSLKRVAASDYQPTTDDILHARILTTGITETRFHFSNLDFLLVDVGGQRNERKKWIHCFEGVTALLFISAISEYDQRLFEDEDVNRLLESMTLFDEISNSRWFADTSIILFLNKTDIFREKLAAGKNISMCFPAYTGPTEYQESLEYIQARFQALSRTEDKLLYMHTTCATDTSNIQVVFNAVKDIIIQQNLRRTGFM